MKYTIEATGNRCVETLELRSGKKYTKKHLRTSTGFRCEDEAFAEQLEADGVDLEIIDGASDLFDGAMSLDFMDMARYDW